KRANSSACRKARRERATGKTSARRVKAEPVMRVSERGGRGARGPVSRVARAAAAKGLGGSDHPEADAGTRASRTRGGEAGVEGRVDLAGATANKNRRSQLRF